MTVALLDLERTALSSRHLRAKSGRVEVRAFYFSEVPLLYFLDGKRVEIAVAEAELERQGPGRVSQSLVKVPR